MSWLCKIARDATLAKAARYFKLEQFGTNVTTEILAGTSTYLSLAYIFIVNPAILAQAGIDAKSALFATAVISCLATFAMGIWANLPFAVAPGLTMNSYFTFVVCKKMHLTWQQGLATVFISGVLCVILTALPVRQAIIDSIPQGLKKAIAVTIGVFVTVIGLFLAKILSFTPSGLMDVSAITVASLTSPLAIVLYTGLAISIVLGLRRLHFPAGMIVAIISSSLLYHVLIKTPPASLLSGGNVLASIAQLDFSGFLRSSFWVPVIVFFVLDFFEGIGGFIGMTAGTTIQDKNGNIPNIKQGLWVDGLGTMGGAFMGTSSLIIFVESAVGIKAGGRTGLTAVICAIWMLICAIASFYFAPLLGWFPAQAVAGILVYVGYLLLSGSVESRKEDGLTCFDYSVMAIMSLISFATFSLDKSLALGFWAYFALSLIPGKIQKPSWWLGAIAAAMSAAIVFSG